PLCPCSVPARQVVAERWGLVLLIEGAGTILKRSSTVSALILTINVAIWLLLLQLPRVAMNPTVEAAWLGFSENLVMVAGGWLVLTSAADPGYRVFGRLAIDGSATLGARLLFAAALTGIGLSRLLYGQETAARCPPSVAYQSA